MRLHQHADPWQPAAFASRPVTESEWQYSQIKKEALAHVWACEKFPDYVIGKDITLETDHKLLMLILGKTTGLPTTKSVVLPNSLDAFLVYHQSCCRKQLYTKNTLSRAPVATPDSTHLAEERCTECFVADVVSLSSQCRLSTQESYTTAQLPLLHRTHCPFYIRIS